MDWPMGSGKLPLGQQPLSRRSCWLRRTVRLQRIHRDGKPQVGYVLLLGKPERQVLLPVSVTSERNRWANVPDSGRPTTERWRIAEIDTEYLVIWACPEAARREVASDAETDGDRRAAFAQWGWRLRQPATRGITAFPRVSLTGKPSIDFSTKRSHEKLAVFPRWTRWRPCSIASCHPSMTPPPVECGKNGNRQEDRGTVSCRSTP